MHRRDALEGFFLPELEENTDGGSLFFRKLKTFGGRSKDKDAVKHETKGEQLPQVVGVVRLANHLLA